MLNKKVSLGIGLIIIGLIILLGNMDYLAGDFTLLLIGAGFLLMYFVSGKKIEERKVGFLIPSTILLMIGVFVLLEENYNLGKLEGSLFFYLLGTAFILVYLIHTMHFTGGFGERNWALITAGGVYLFATFILAIEYFDSEIVATIFGNFWPIILIVIGLFMILRGFQKK